MKKILLYLIPAFLSLYASAQAPDWKWARSAGGYDYDKGSSIISDGNGNVYVVGIFTSDSIMFGNTTLYNEGGSDIYIAKYSNNGIIRWARRAGGHSDDFGISIATDTVNDLYITGSFNSDSITFGSTILTNTLSGNVFLAKYDSLGTAQWAIAGRGANNAFGRDVVTDIDKNVYLTGFYYGDSIVFDNNALYSTGNADFFIFKFNRSGNALWARSSQGFDDELSYAITADSGSIYITGGFYSDSLLIGSDTLVNKGGIDIFIARYDSSGNELWARSAGGSIDDYGIDICNDMSGRIYSTATFNSDTLTVDTFELINAGSRDIATSRHDTAGNLIWMNRCGSDSTDWGNSIAVDMFGNIYLTGSFYSDTLVFGSDVLLNAGYNDIFIAKYDTAGSERWARSAGSISSDESFGVCTDTGGRIIITGMYNLAVTFDTTTLAFTDSADMFVAMLDSGIVLGIDLPYFSSNDLKIFPNPSGGTFRVVSSKGIDELKIFNTLGQIVYESRPEGNTDAIQLSTVPDGIYFIRAVTNSRSTTRKLVISGE